MNGSKIYRRGENQNNKGENNDKKVQQKKKNDKFVWMGFGR